MNDRAKAILDFWFDEMVVEKRFKRDDNFPYYLNVKFSDEIKDDIKKIRKELEFLTAEDKLELEELRGDPDETTDVYDAIVNNLVDDEEDREEEDIN